MSQIKKLYEDKTKIHDALTALKGESEKRSLTADEITKIGEHQKALETIETELRARGALDATLAGKLKGQGLEDESETRAKPKPKYDAKEFRERIKDFCFSGSGFEQRDRMFIAAPSAEELREVMSRQRENRDLLTTAQTGGVGPNEFYGQYVRTMRTVNGVMNANVWFKQTATGNPFLIPTVDDTANTGSVRAESSTTNGSNGDPSLANKSLSAYTYEGGVVKLSMEMLQDNEFDLGALVVDLSTERVADKLNADMTNNSSAGSARGIVPDATAGITTAASLTLGFDDFIKQEGNIEPKYLPNAQYMMSMPVLSIVRSLKDASGRYIVQPGNGPNNFTINGFPVVINQKLPKTLAASGKAILFGDFSKFMVRQAGGIEIIRYGELYRPRIGFQVQARYDSILADAAAVQYMTIKP